MQSDREPDEEPVLSLWRLNGDEGGLWKVTTQSSHYIFDLDQGTVIRVPGSESSSSVNDVSRPLRSIGSCEVGVRGYWTMEPGEEQDLEYYWQYSTEIRSIER